MVGCALYQGKDWLWQWLDEHSHPDGTVHSGEVTYCSDNISVRNSHSAFKNKQTNHGVHLAFKTSKTPAKSQTTAYLFPTVSTRQRASLAVPCRATFPSSFSHVPVSTSPLLLAQTTWWQEDRAAELCKQTFSQTHTSLWGSTLRSSGDGEGPFYQQHCSFSHKKSTSNSHTFQTASFIYCKDTPEAAANPGKFWHLNKWSICWASGAAAETLALVTELAGACHLKENFLSAHQGRVEAGQRGKWHAVVGKTVRKEEARGLHDRSWERSSPVSQTQPTNPPFLSKGDTGLGAATSLA